MLNVSRQILKRNASELVRDQRGASFIEYVIVAGLVAIAAIGAFRAFGGAIDREIRAEERSITGIGGGGGGGGGGGAAP